MADDSVVTFKWSEAMTRKLIRLRGQNKYLFSGKVYASQKAWGTILNALNLKGVISLQQVRKKWHNMLQEYKKYKKLLSDGLIMEVSWPYFKIMAETVEEDQMNFEARFMSIDALLAKAEYWQGNNFSLMGHGGLPSELCHKCGSSTRVVIRKKTSADGYVQEYDTRRCTKKGCQAYKIIGQASSSKSLPASYQKAIGSQKAGLPNQSFVPKLCKTSPTPGTSRPQQMRIAPKPQSPIPTPMLVPIPSPVQVSQDVCLRWNSYHTNMQNSFPMLLDTEQFVDVTLACEGQFIKCHKMVLSACSTFFNDLLSQNPCQHPIIVLRGSRMWEVRALVDFMYRGEVNVAQDKLASLLSAAEEFQVKGLAGSSSKAPDSSPSGAPIKADVSDLGSDAGEEIHNSPPKKMFKRKMATNPSYNDHRPTSSQPSRPLQRIKIKPLPPQHRGESPEPSDAFPITHEALTTQQHKRIKNETNIDNEPSTSRRDNTQIKEECMEFEDFDMGSNSGSFADQNYSQNDSQYDNENSSDPLNTG